MPTVLVCLNRWLLGCVPIVIVACREAPRHARPEPSARPLLGLDTLAWLRPQPLAIIGPALAQRGWRLVSARQDDRCTIYRWTHPAAPADTVAQAFYPPGTGSLLHYTSPRRQQYARVMRAIRQRRLPVDGHSGPDSTMLAYAGPTEYLILTVDVDKPGSRYEVSLEYRDPTISAEALDWPPPPEAKD